MKRLAIKADDKNAACAVENSRRGWENPPKACDFFIVLICKKTVRAFRMDRHKKNRGLSTAVFCKLIAGRVADPAHSGQAALP